MRLSGGTASISTEYSAPSGWTGTMSPSRFAYKTITKSDETEEVGSIMAHRYSADRILQAVMWHARRKIWMFAPAIAVAYLNDWKYMNRATEVDRATAERIARETLGSELPTLETLDAMCEEGERMGWELGPPEE
jgi:hypothetical protein